MKYFYKLFFLCNLLSINILSAQSTIGFNDAASMSMGNVNTVGSQAILLGNPAAVWSQKNQTQVSIGAQNRFQLKELNLFHIGAIVQRGGNHFGVRVNYLGVLDVKNYTFGLAYTKQLSQKLYMGIRANFSQYVATSYGNTQLFHADLGLFSPLNKKIALGCWVKNIARSKTSFSEFNAPAFNVGLAFSPSKKVQLLVENEKYLSEKANWKAGLLYHPMEALSLRAGCQSNPTMPTFGVGYQIKNKFKLDIGSNSHPTLGFSTGINLWYIL